MSLHTLGLLMPDRTYLQIAFMNSKRSLRFCQLNIDSDGRTCWRDYSHCCESNQGHGGMPQENKQDFVSEATVEIYDAIEKVEMQGVDKMLRKMGNYIRKMGLF